MPIYYLSENQIPVPRIRRLDVRRWIRSVLQSYGHTLGDLSYMFTDEPGILAANLRYLGHDYYTDIITFEPAFAPEACPQEENAPAAQTPISGDILISLPTVAYNARRYNVPYSRELARVMVHGILHLCGLEDRSPQEEKAMRAAEEAALRLLDQAFPGPANPFLRVTPPPVPEPPAD